MKFFFLPLLFIVHFFLLFPLYALDSEDDEFAGTHHRGADQSIAREPGFWDKAMAFFYSDHFELAGQEFMQLSKVPPRYQFSKEEIQLPETGSVEEYGFDLPMLDKCYGSICYLLAGQEERARQIAQEIAQDPIFARMAPDPHLFTLFHMLDMNEQTAAMARKMKEEEKEEKKPQTNFSRFAQVLSGISLSETATVTQTQFSHDLLMTLDGHPLFAMSGLDVFLTNIAVYRILGQLHEAKTELEKARDFLNRDLFFSTYRANRSLSLENGTSEHTLPGAEIIPCYTMFLSLRDVEREIDIDLHRLQERLLENFIERAVAPAFVEAASSSQ